MYGVVYSKQFKRSLKKLQRSGGFSHAAAAEYKHVIDVLISKELLPPVYRDHALTAEYLGYRECHIRGDLLLIYEIKKDMLVLLLINIGSHSQLFG